MEIQNETDITEEVEDSENLENDNLTSEEIDSGTAEESTNTANDEVDASETNDETIKKKDKSETVSSVRKKLVELPLSKVKSIMKLDPDCHLISKDALFMTSKATELFLQAIGKETFKYTQMGKRKMLVKRDFDNAINNVSSLCFLDGTLEQLC
ncbi:histone-like transcription factor ccaat-related [Holotrichia oblita]|uniref:Histone-like transcription factor ccaat-related n=1 Tax=Holotrichia oblita TaxID=644536 RepID=A0ACB9T511_HOLOL|nr:histone-like transcription factor ccaat-related [Holotrichia oblita]